MTMFYDQSKVVDLIEISEDQVSNVILKGFSDCLTCEGKSILVFSLSTFYSAYKII